jgi:hypothetical protein
VVLCGPLWYLVVAVFFVGQTAKKGQKKCFLRWDEIRKFMFFNFWLNKEFFHVSSPSAPPSEVSTPFKEWKRHKFSNFPIAFGAESLTLDVHKHEEMSCVFFCCDQFFESYERSSLHY